MDETLRREGLEVHLRKTGCPGLCGDEVLVSIAKPGYPRITYRRMTSLSVQELVVDFLKGDDPHSDWALASEEPLEGIPSWKDLTFWAKQERRVQRLRQAIPPVGEGKPDGEIICELGETAVEKTFKTL